MSEGGDIVLALDLATTLGWASGPVGGKPVSGKLRLGDKNATRAEKFAHLMRFLNDRLKVERPRLVVIEEVLNPRVLLRVGATLDTAKTLYGLPAVAEAVLRIRGVPRIEFVNVQNVRAHFVGQRRFKDETDPETGKKIKSRDNAKAAVINACRLRGWAVESHDEADAIATWSYGCMLLDKRLAAIATPLFARVSS